MRAHSMCWRAAWQPGMSAATLIPAIHLQRGLRARPRRLAGVGTAAWAAGTPGPGTGALPSRALALRHACWTSCWLPGALCTAGSDHKDGREWERLSAGCAARRVQIVNADVSGEMLAGAERRSSITTAATNRSAQPRTPGAGARRVGDLGPRRHPRRVSPVHLERTALPSMRACMGRAWGHAALRHDVAQAPLGLAQDECHCWRWRRWQCCGACPGAPSRGGCNPAPGSSRNIVRHDAAPPHPLPCQHSTFCGGTGGGHEAPACAWVVPCQLSSPAPQHGWEGITCALVCGRLEAWPSGSPPGRSCIRLAHS